MSASAAAERLVVGAYDLDDGLVAAAAAAGRPLVRVAPAPRTMVVLGAGGKPEVELRAEACLADGVPVLRRGGGGCAVVLDPGNVIVSVVYRAPGFGGSPAHFARISAWLIAGLARCGVRGASVAAGSDLVVGERKFGGACIRRARGLLHYSTSLLVDPDLSLLPRNLAHPPREPEYRRGRGHLDFVRPLAALGPFRAASLAPALAAALDPAALAAQTAG